MLRIWRLEGRVWGGGLLCGHRRRKHIHRSRSDTTDNTTLLCQIYYNNTALRRLKGVRALTSITKHRKDVRAAYSLYFTDVYDAGDLSVHTTCRKCSHINAVAFDTCNNSARAYTVCWPPRLVPSAVPNSPRTTVPQNRQME
jgi:hypothetical protein